MLRFGLLGAGRIGQVHGSNAANPPSARLSPFLIRSPRCAPIACCSDGR